MDVQDNLKTIIDEVKKIVSLKEAFFVWVFCLWYSK